MCDDVKIKKDSSPEEKYRQELVETESIVAMLYNQKQNGNIDRARSLGRKMAEQVDADDGEFCFGYDADENDQVILQRRMLLAFTVKRGFELFCPNMIVTKTANNQFFDIIHKNSPHIYADIQANGAFSYYTLCIRDSREPEECIGETFAQLSGHNGDKIYSELGEALYLHFLDLVAKEVNKLEFVK